MSLELRIIDGLDYCHKNGEIDSMSVVFLKKKILKNVIHMKKTRLILYKDCIFVQQKYKFLNISF